MSAKQLAATLTEAGLELPAPIKAYLEGRPVPFAHDTRARLRAWSRAHGYSAKHHNILNQLVHRIATHDRYRKAVVSGEVHRMDLDGQDTGPVSEAEREHAAKSLATATRTDAPAPNPTSASPPVASSSPNDPAAPEAADRVLEGLALASQAAAKQEIVTVAPVFPPGRRASPRAVAVEKRPVRAFKRPPAASASRPGEAPTNGAPRPQVKPYVPAPHVRRTVEDVGGRRNSVRLIVAYHTGRTRGRRQSPSGRPGRPRRSPASSTTDTSAKQPRRRCASSSATCSCSPCHGERS